MPFYLVTLGLDGKAEVLETTSPNESDQIVLESFPSKRRAEQRRDIENDRTRRELLVLGMRSCVIESRTARFWADVQEFSSGKAKARYFGPNDTDRGVKDHEGNWPGIQKSVGDQLEELEIGLPE